MRYRRTTEIEEFLDPSGGRRKFPIGTIVYVDRGKYRVLDAPDWSRWIFFGETVPVSPLEVLASQAEESA